MRSVFHAQMQYFDQRQTNANLLPVFPYKPVFVSLANKDLTAVCVLQYYDTHRICFIESLATSIALESSYQTYYISRVMPLGDQALKDRKLSRM